ncbi:hypothetical protein K435DRAFT_779605, partial [Dendrothele bispora CBS 962.96]
MHTKSPGQEDDNKTCHPRRMVGEEVNREAERGGDGEPDREADRLGNTDRKADRGA